MKLYKLCNSKVRNIVFRHVHCLKTRFEGPHMDPAHLIISIDHLNLKKSFHFHSFNSIATYDNSEPIFDIKTSYWKRQLLTQQPPFLQDQIIANNSAN